jgi:hypothetical protein
VIGVPGQGLDPRGQILDLGVSITQFYLGRSEGLPEPEDATLGCPQLGLGVPDDRIPLLAELGDATASVPEDSRPGVPVFSDGDTQPRVGETGV